MSAIMGSLLATAATGAALATDVIVIGTVANTTAGLARQQEARERPAPARRQKRSSGSRPRPRMLDEWW